MKIKVSETTPLQFDWMVAKCEDIGKRRLDPDEFPLLQREGRYLYSTNPAQGQPILEREGIDILKIRAPDGKGWRAYHTPTHEAKTHTFAEGPTMLIAGLRCYVASKLGDEVEVPDELAQP